MNIGKKRELLARFRNLDIFTGIKKILHPPKKIAERMINDVVVKKLAEFEIHVKANFRIWYTQSIINVVIVAVLVLTGLASWIFSDTTGVFKLLVALAWLFSITVFLYRRIRNIQSIYTNRKAIATYGALIIPRLFHYKFGTKTWKITYVIYQRMYNEYMDNPKKILHRVASKVRLVPTYDEVFDIIYEQFLHFFRSVIIRNLVKLFFFLAVFTVLSLIVKNSVLNEMHFTNALQTIVYPFMYLRGILESVSGH